MYITEQVLFKTMFVVLSVGSTSPAVLKYLGDAGLLSDVSALVARARAQDEANMRKLQNQAKGRLI